MTRSKVGKEIEQGLQEIVDHLEGKKELKTFRKHLKEKCKDKGFEEQYEEEKALTHEQVKQRIFEKDPQSKIEYDALEEEYRKKSEKIRARNKK